MSEWVMYFGVRNVNLISQTIIMDFSVFLNVKRVEGPDMVCVRYEVLTLRVPLSRLKWKFLGFYSEATRMEYEPGYRLSYQSIYS
jgi:hypothetical protein